MSEELFWLDPAHVEIPRLPGRDLLVGLRESCRGAVFRAAVAGQLDPLGKFRPPARCRARGAGRRAARADAADRLRLRRPDREAEPPHRAGRQPGRRRRASGPAGQPEAQAARRTATVNVRLGDSASLGAASASYDRVAACSSCCTSNRKRCGGETLAEAVRVMKPGGSIVIVDYHQPHALASAALADGAGAGAPGAFRARLVAPRTDAMAAGGRAGGSSPAGTTSAGCTGAW